MASTDNYGDAGDHIQGFEAANGKYSRLLTLLHEQNKHALMFWLQQVPFAIDNRIVYAIVLENESNV